MSASMPVVPTVKFGGTALSPAENDDLLAVSVDRGLRRAARAEITFNDPYFETLQNKATTFAPGTEVSVSFPDPAGTAKTVFDGTVTGLRVSCPSDADYRTAVTIVAEDAGAGLNHVGKNSSTANTTLADALRAALKPHVSGTITIEGLPAGTREAVLVACSAHDLLEQICDRYGVEWWVDPADRSFNVKAAPTAPSPMALTLGEDLRDLDFQAAGKTTGTVSMRGWDPATKAEITGTNPAAAAATRPAVLTGATGFAQADTALEYQAHPFSVVDAADLTAQATAHASRLARSGTVLTVRTVNVTPGISPRDDLELKGAGPLSGKHPVVAVRHEWGTTSMTTVVAGERPGGSAQRRDETIGGVVGPVPGLITDIKDPKTLGRVKVKLPTLGDSVQTGWARTVLSSAGPQRGMVVPHRVDDEVLVGFEEGDLQRPVVLGALHNGKDAAPVATGGRDADLSAGLTSGNGHQVVLTDAAAPGSNVIDIQHASKHQVLLAGDQVLIKAETGTPLKLVAGQASITLDASGKVEIKGVSVSVIGQTSVSVSGLQVSAKADAALTLEGAASTSVKGATVSVSADALASVKGASVAIN
ncbi:hypothetical protein KIH74_04715 [Kineosporia sp. J2-2]|uniref:Gp5/Type VI secretion system Vgr protein OB-fold domain-containing protein n=1 Tax=Kineosporia corallincola TaxID=2835133 RepID=A0ABS5TAX8_9ACTN|nr:phage baseplate assembly protein V [Kineosporia corallincola]MBT0768212.1 hypothetical protein [Kineosporia corallincola]